MPQRNDTMNKAKRNKDDEFYTPREMIDAELKHYSAKLFKGKRILCNCDDPDHSEFFRYFADNFDRLELEQLVGLRYAGSALPFAPEPNKGDEFRPARYRMPISKDTPAFKRSLFADKNGRKHGTGRMFLRGDSGGFDDREGLRQLKDCDIVVTNPPFSRWRDFMRILVESNKQFLVIGNLNAATNIDMFPLITNGKVWLGGKCKGEFIRPDKSGSKLGFAVWFTNLPHNRRIKEEVPLTATYTAQDYPKYDNFPAIEVGRVKDIPADYQGEMGVPVSYLEKHNPQQFEIRGGAIFSKREDILEGEGCLLAF